MAANTWSGTLFVDDFNRTDSAVAGNGWGEYAIQPNGSPGPDMVTILGNRLRIAHTNDGQNRDAGIFRPFSETCGVVVTATVEWTNGPNASAIVSVNGLPNFDPLGLRILLNPSNFFVFNENETLAQIPVSLDTSQIHNIEWIVNSDCSTEARTWPAGSTKPGVPTATSASTTLQARVNPQLVLGTSGGAGCCTYPGYDLRFDDLTVVAANGTPLTLEFPIDGSSPQLHIVDALLDHAGSFNREDGVVEAADGTRAYCTDDDGEYFIKTRKECDKRACSELDGREPLCGLYEYKVCKDEGRDPSSPCLELKDPPIEIAGFRYNRGEPRLSYDGHSGYDYPPDPSDRIVAPAEGVLCLATPKSAEDDPFFWRTGELNADGTLICPYSSDDVNSSGSDSWDAQHTFYILHDNGWSTWYLHAGSGRKWAPGGENWLKRVEKCMKKGGLTTSECEELASIEGDKKSKPPLSPDVSDGIRLDGYVEVRSRDHIGFIGDWGVKSKHLHFEVRDERGKGRDPYKEGLWSSP